MGPVTDAAADSLSVDVALTGRLMAGASRTAGDRRDITRSGRSDLGGGEANSEEAVTPGVETVSALCGFLSARWTFPSMDASDSVSASWGVTSNVTMVGEMREAF